MNRPFDPMQFVHEAVDAAYQGVLVKPTIRILEAPTAEENMSTASATFMSANRVLVSPDTVRALLTDERARMHMHYDVTTGEVRIEDVKVVKDVDMPFGHFAVAFVNPIRKP